MCAWARAPTFFTSRFLAVIVPYLLRSHSSDEGNKEDNSEHAHTHDIIPNHSKNPKVASCLTKLCYIIEKIFDYGLKGVCLVCGGVWVRCVCVRVCALLVLTYMHTTHARTCINTAYEHSQEGREERHRGEMLAD